VWAENSINKSSSKVQWTELLHTNNFTEQSPFSEANSHSASREISRLSRNPKVHYRFHNSPLWSLSWTHPISIKIHFNIHFSSTPLSSAWFLPFRFSDQKYCMHFSCRPCVLCARPSHLLDLITLIIFWGTYKLWSSTLCSLLQYFTTSMNTSQGCLQNTGWLIRLFNDAVPTTEVIQHWTRWKDDNVWWMYTNLG
jgi:hypothetical protein